MTINSKLPFFRFDSLSFIHSVKSIFFTLISIYIFPRMGADYYKVLGIQKGANEDQIKKAYRKMALKSTSCALKQQ